MKKTQPCSSMEEISKYYSAGDRSVLDGHFESCPQCAKVWDELDTIRRAALDAPTYTPSATQAEHIENQLLNQAIQTRPQPKASRLRYAIPIAACLAAGLVFAVATKTPSSGGARSGSVVAQAGSNFEHFTRFEGNEREAEIVRVRDGQVHLDVAKLAKNKSFKVVTSNGEVEVWGTSFNVVVKDDRLMAVNVNEGVVALRVPGDDERVLRAGQKWRRRVKPETTAALVADDSAQPPKNPDDEQLAIKPEPKSQKLPQPRPMMATTNEAVSPVPDRGPADISVSDRTPTVTPPPVERSTAEPNQPAGIQEEAPQEETPKEETKEPAEQDSLRLDVDIPEITPPAEDFFATGWSALKANDPKRAAPAFAQAAELAAGQALAEDASYWYAVALVRAEDRRASSAVANFLERYADSDRAPEAWVMRGWQHHQNGQREAARAAFETAQRTGREEVKRAAAAGLAKLEP